MWMESFMSAEEASGQSSRSGASPSTGGAATPRRRDPNTVWMESNTLWRWDIYWYVTYVELRNVGHAECLQTRSGCYDVFWRVLYRWEEKHSVLLRITSLKKSLSAEINRPNHFSLLKQNIYLKVDVPLNYYWINDLDYDRPANTSCNPQISVHVAGNKIS